MKNRLVLAVLLAFVAVSDPAHAADRFNGYLWPTLGQEKSSDWYEWWYSKVVEPKTGRAFFFVYGVVNPWDRDGQVAHSRAGVTFGDFGRRLQIERRFPVTQFRAKRGRYDVAIGEPTVATADERHLRGELVSEDGVRVSWNLRFEEAWAFRAMGWAMQIPDLLNIGWYPAQASARVSGVIRVGDEVIELDRAPGYQDRNWGRTFPKWWSWIVANHWNEGSDGVLVAGGGAPEVLGRPSPYEGMSIGFRYDGQVYSFRPTDGVFPRTEIRFGKWEMRATDLFGNRIEVSAYAPPESFMDLQFLTPQGQIFHDWEALTGSVKLKFTPFGGRPVTLTSSLGGIEWGSPDGNGPNP